MGSDGEKQDKGDGDVMPVGTILRTGDLDALRKETHLSNSRPHSRFTTVQSYLAVLILTAVVGCATDTTGTVRWQSVASRDSAPQLAGTWENSLLGHIVKFSSTGIEVFHRLDGFCIQDTGVVPPYTLFAFGVDSNELLLHYYDYRNHTELLHAPLAFSRISAIPAPCTSEYEFSETSDRDVFSLIWKTFDRYYAFFEERGVDWHEVRRIYEPQARAACNDDELFDVLSRMLGTLDDGHVNLSRGERRYNAGRPRLRARLVDVWKNRNSDLSEQAFVATWHRTVQDSVYSVLDAGSLRSGAAGALEWGTIGETVGYVRVNRFESFTEEPAPRPQQYNSLRDALRAMSEDLRDTTSSIVDVALNGGGSDAAALTVAAYFADVPREVLQYKVRDSPVQHIRLSPAAEPYDRPILLLTSEVTASAAESFVLIMRAFPHVTHVGERTRGGLSSLLPKPFPREFMATISYQQVLDDEGKQYEVSGISPSRRLALFPADDIQNGFAKALKQLAKH